MNNLPTAEKLATFKMVDVGMIQVPGIQAYLKKQILDITELMVANDDIINSIASNEIRSIYLIIATEKGLVYFFNFEKNEFEGVVQIENSTTSTFKTKKEVLVSTFAKNVSVLNIRSRILINSIRADFPENEAFGSKGIFFILLRKDRQLIMNSGYAVFKIYDALTRKILKTFNVCSDYSWQDGYRGPPKVVINYGVNCRHNVLAFILKGKPEIHFYDLRVMRVFKSIKLYNPDDLPPKMFLLNSIIASANEHMCIILQFAFNSESNTKVISVLVLVQVTAPEEGSLDANTILHHKFQYGNDLYISHLFFPLTKAGSHGSCDNGFVLAVGTRKGLSIASIIDLRVNKVFHLTIHQKCDSDEIASMARYGLKGSLSATPEGLIILIDDL